MRWWAFQFNAQSPSIARLQSNPQRVGKGLGNIRNIVSVSHEFGPSNRKLKKRTKIYINAIFELFRITAAAIWNTKAKSSKPNRFSETGIDPSIWSKKPRLHTWPILGLAGVGSKLEPAAGLGITWVPLCFVKEESIVYIRFIWNMVRKARELTDV